MIATVGTEISLAIPLMILSVSLFLWLVVSKTIENKKLEKENERLRQINRKYYFHSAEK